jgi:hypothetical protein
VSTQWGGVGGTNDGLLIIIISGHSLEKYTTRT